MFRLLRHKKILIPLLLLLTAGGYFYFRSANAQPEVTTTNVKIGDIVKTISASGVITAGPNREVYSLAAGTIEQILVKDGETVTQGQKLVQLDQVSLVAAVDTARASIESAKKTLEALNLETVSESQRIALQAEVDKTKAIHDNAEKLARDNPFGASAQDALVTAKSNYEAAKKNYGEAFRQAPQPQEYKSAAIALESANRNYYKALNDLSKAALTAPLAGIFVLANPISVAGAADTSKKLAKGMSVAAGQKLAQIFDPNTLYFEAEVDETEIPQVKSNQPATVTLNAFGDKKFTTTVDNIGNLAFTTTSGATAYKTWFRVSTIDDLKLGMNGEVEIEVDKRMNVLHLPSEAIKEKDDDKQSLPSGEVKKVVEIRSGQEFKEIEIKAGLSNDLETEVTEGLTEGQEVIVSRSDKK